MSFCPWPEPGRGALPLGGPRQGQVHVQVQQEVRRASGMAPGLGTSHGCDWLPKAWPGSASHNQPPTPVFLGPGSPHASQSF